MQVRTLSDRLRVTVQELRDVKIEAERIKSRQLEQKNVGEDLNAFKSAEEVKFAVAAS